MTRKEGPLDLALPRGLIAQIRRRAHATGASETDVVVAALKAHFRPPAKSERRRSDERLLAPLRSLLAEALIGATSWHQLNRRLAGQGLVLVASGGGLVLCRLPDGVRLCKLSEIGPGYLALARLFGSAFPGHPADQRRRSSADVNPPSL